MEEQLRTCGKFSFDNYDWDIYFTPDVCHMLKLARNALCHLGCFVDGQKRLVQWFKYFELLHQVQQNEGLKFGNKISNSHVSFHRNKMNGRLAAQLFSSSVVEFLMLSECKEFENAQWTINFIRIIDKLFDLLNSKNPFGKRYKKPLRLADKCEWIDTFNSSI